MNSLFGRNLFFVLIHPGLVAGMFPYLILKSSETTLKLTFWWLVLPALVCFLCGLMILTHCIFFFASIGAGTLSPFDPTQKLVRQGLYRYTRNPMYIGVLLILTGECVVSLSWTLVLYTCLVAILFQIFVVFYEEPSLKRKFGPEYEQYLRQVPRWL